MPDPHPLAVEIVSDLARKTASDPALAIDSYPSVWIVDKHLRRFESYEREALLAECREFIDSAKGWLEYYNRDICRDHGWNEDLYSDIQTAIGLLSRLDGRGK